MAGLVTLEFVQARPGFGGADETELQANIDDASALVRLACKPNLDDTTSDDCPEAIAAVIVNMVRRGTSNPRGNQQETLGDYSYSAGSDGGVATIYLTKREVKIVRKASETLGATTLAMEGYLPVQRSEIEGATASNGAIVGDTWDLVTAGTDD